MGSGSVPRRRVLTRRLAAVNWVEKVARSLPYSVNRTLIRRLSTHAYALTDGGSPCRASGSASSFAAVATATHESGSSFAKVGAWPPLAKTLRRAATSAVTVCLRQIADRKSIAWFSRILASSWGKEAVMLSRSFRRERCAV